MITLRNGHNLAPVPATGLLAVVDTIIGVSEPASLQRGAAVLLWRSSHDAQVFYGCVCSRLVWPCGDRDFRRSRGLATPNAAVLTIDLNNYFSSGGIPTDLTRRRPVTDGAGVVDFTSTNALAANLIRAPAKRSVTSRSRSAMRRGRSASRLPPGSRATLHRACTYTPGSPLRHGFGTANYGGSGDLLDHWQPILMEAIGAGNLARCLAVHCHRGISTNVNNGCQHHPYIIFPATFVLNLSGSTIRVDGRRRSPGPADTCESLALG